MDILEQLSIQNCGRQMLKQQQRTPTDCMRSMDYQNQHQR